MTCKSADFGLRMFTCPLCEQEKPEITSVKVLFLDKICGTCEREFVRKKVRPYQLSYKWRKYLSQKHNMKIRIKLKTKLTAISYFKTQLPLTPSGKLCQ